MESFVPIVSVRIDRSSWVPSCSLLPRSFLYSLVGRVGFSSVVQSPLEMEEQKRRTNEAEIKKVTIVIDDVSSEIKKMTEKFMLIELSIEELNRKKKTSELTEDDLLELDNLQKKCFKLEEQLQNSNQRLNTLESRLILLQQRRERLEQ